MKNKFIKNNIKLIVFIGGTLIFYFLAATIFAILFWLIGLNQNLSSAIQTAWPWVIGIFGILGWIPLYFFKVKKYFEKENEKRLNNNFMTYQEFEEMKNCKLNVEDDSWGWVIESKTISFEDFNKLKIKIKKNKKYSLINYKQTNINNKLVIRMLSECSITCLGSTRTGKSQQIVIPTIIANAKSKIKPILHITDPKMELCKQTAEILKNNDYEVFIFNIKDPLKSNYFNFLDIPLKSFLKYLSLKDNDKEKALSFRNNSFTELDTISTMLMVPNEKSGDSTENYFSLQGKELFLGFAKIYLELIEEEFNKTGIVKSDFFNLPSIFKNLKETNREDIIKISKNKISIEKDWISSLAFAEQNNDAEKIISLKNEKPINYAQTHLAQAMSEDKQYQFYLKSINKGLMHLNDQAFEILSLKNNFDYESYLEKPVAIFVVIPDEDKTKGRLATAFLDTLYMYTVKKIDSLPNGKNDRPILRILEEFNHLDPMNTLRSAILAGGGRNIWTMLVIQSRSAVNNLYGKDEALALLSNTAGIIYVGNNESATNQDIIETLGTYEEISWSNSRNESETSTNRSVSHSNSETERKILKMSDLRLKKNNRIHLLLNNKKPILNIRTLPSYRIYEKELKTSENYVWPKVSLLELDNWISDYHISILKKNEKKSVHKENEKLIDEDSKKTIEKNNETELSLDKKIYETFGSLISTVEKGKPEPEDEDTEFGYAEGL